jgi:mannose-6-phosphate isomerase-like protein (cupin superfamily)
MQAIAGKFFTLLAMLVAPMALAQSATVDHLTQSQLLDAASKLEKAASNDGAASAQLAEYPSHFTMIALRKKSGVAEIHEKYADFFFVVRGQATLVSGGTVVDPKTVQPGEIQGTSVQDGTSISLHEGDFVHIPSHVPHQLLLTNSDSRDFVYFVIKVREQ